MPLSSGVVAEIQAKVDLLSYVSQYVSLKKRGREYVGLCPFHAERTPSFALNAEKRLWHCYGCGAGGDLIRFVQRHENVDFGAALRLLAKRAGITLDEQPAARRRRSEREAIYEANAVAQSYFAAALRKHQIARDYLNARGIQEQTARTFGVGYAPDSWDGLAGSLGRAGVDLALAARAGLVKPRPQGDGYYDFFRDRLMLPVYNLTGEVIAFGGRALGDEQPKYINTPNTPVYTKGQHAYGLHLARRAAQTEGALVVVEGYLDAIGLYQAGFTNAVASLGTAFTPEQAREIRRVATNLYLCFDGDAAGQAATARSIDMLVDEGLRVRVAALPKGLDPDELIKQGGPSAFAALLEASTPWVEFKIEVACRRIAAKFASKSDVAREAMEVIARVRDPIERDQYTKEMARRLGVSESSLRQQRRAPAQSMTAATNGDRAPARSAPKPTEPLSKERELLQLLITRPDLLPKAKGRIDADELDDETLRGVYAHLLAHADDLARGLNPLSIFAEYSNIGDLTRLALAAPPLSAAEDEQRFERVAEHFDQSRRERRLSTVDEEINRLLNAGQSVPKPLRDEYNALAEILRGRITNERR